MSRLETDRLLLTLYTEQDKPDFVDLLTDRAVMRFVDNGPLNSDQAEALWRKLMHEFYPDGVDTIWAVFTKADKRYVGNASLRPRPERQKDWEIGYYLKPGEWNKGFATEIASVLVRHGFDVAGLDEIYATVDKENTASIHVLEKCGLRFFRKEYDARGVFHVYRIAR
ncbi:MAG TPA: GNAT family N-acetyltransferase [Pyrinomonadaceae bacterium]|nr:GNAT family N-acetyltransferase [Pyrinomonadaceae bacterium]